jgi:hypothetical protein
MRLIAEPSILTMDACEYHTASCRIPLTSSSPLISHSEPMMIVVDCTSFWHLISDYIAAWMPAQCSCSHMLTIYISLLLLHLLSLSLYSSSRTFCSRYHTIQAHACLLTYMFTLFACRYHPTPMQVRKGETELDDSPAHAHMLRSVEEVHFYYRQCVGDVNIK